MFSVVFSLQNKSSTVVKATLRPTEQRGGVNKAHYHLKTHALKNRAVFDQVK